MKKLVIILLSVFLFFSSCTQNDNGHLVISNENMNENYLAYYISEVYISSDDGKTKSKIFEGKLYKDETYFFEIKPGSYRVYATVKGSFSELNFYEESFDTGYKNPVKIDSADYVKVVYDGNGLYKD